jgi:hypothetical protein
VANGLSNTLENWIIPIFIQKTKEMNPNREKFVEIHGKVEAKLRMAKKEAIFSIHAQTRGEGEK